MAFVVAAIVGLLTFCAIFKLTSSELEESPKIIGPRNGGAARELRQQQLQSQAQIAHLSEQIGRMEKRISELEASRKSYPTVQFRNVKDRKRILITGGAGFVGSHLTDKLMAEGHEVS